ncbi:hypothetical protein NLJ89_g154 [Agrocybe chaxingu]|uniref:Threonine/serine exporter-like N-terminal domain-containing protein n=1 Tax=Agrocybe chaxingu TaxID=84603 RepID=A0A9W8N2B8_9AGAR|nr:hypothetical protein NLJ89_g154 [Agrocybe chaxingu]
MSSSSNGHTEQPSPSHSPHPSRRFSALPLGALQPLVPPAANNDPPRSGANRKFSLTSYEHPYDIAPPEYAYNGPSTPSFSAHRSPGLRRSSPVVAPEDPEEEPEKPATGDAHVEQEQKRRGLLSNMMDWYSMARSGTHSIPEMTKILAQPSLRLTMAIRVRSGTAAKCGEEGRRTSNASVDSEMMDPDDPRVTGVKAKQLGDQVDLERNTLRQMDYKTRRKHIQRIRIEFNVSSMKDRQDFLLKLARSLMTFGAPSHRIESQLVAAARILEVEAEFIHLPGIIICSLVIKTSAVQKPTSAVVHDEISAKQAGEHLEALIHAPAPYSDLFRCILAFFLSALICPLAFGGSFVDMWIAGVAAFALSWLQLRVAGKSALYANVFEITVSIVVSFAARGLSSIRSQIFCYTAISSSGIVGILPGYLILSSSLELASKNIVCGSVKMVYALIYTLFLGFGLQIGNDFYLLLDPVARNRLDALAASLSATVSLTGTWVADNSTNGTSVPMNGTWTFSRTFIIVPLFSTLSSLANLQPFRSKQLPVMVIISCFSYASNRIANHYIFNRSDVVSAIGAFTVGLLGNIYSRRMGGTAFTSMVTGVLFLVPSGLSQAGGITANGNGIDIGGAMIAVTIGITVGLFMSQALVYTFGSRKNAAVFSF